MHFFSTNSLIFKFLICKRENRIERAVASLTFSNDKFWPGARLKLFSLIAQQDAYLDLFLKLSNS